MFGRGTSLWMKTAPDPAYPRLTGEHTVDVAVIGGGITGLTAAYFLKRAGKTVAVIERGMIAGGTTGHTTGKVSSQHGIVYQHLADYTDERTARTYARSNQDAIGEIERIIRREGIDCDWRRADNYVFTERADQVETIKKEAKAAAALGLPALFEKNVPLPFPNKGGMRFTDQAAFHARKYALGLARCVDGGGSYVFQDSRVRSYRDSRPCRVRTAEGTVLASDVIMTTNVPYRVSTRSLYAFWEYPRQSYLIALKISEALPPAMYITPGSPTRSLLPVTLDGEEYLLVGGENHLPYLGGGSGRHYRRLEAYARERFPVESVPYRWNARDYVAIDHVPLAGRLLPWSRHLHTGTAFMKWGLTNGTLAGMTLADRILGERNDRTRAFDVARMTPVSWARKMWKRFAA